MLSLEQERILGSVTAIHKHNTEILKKTLGFKVIAPPTELNFVAKVNLMAMDKRIETLLECTAVFNHDNE